MAFLDRYRPNFATLERAEANGRLALLECQDKRTGKLCAVIVAVSDTAGSEEYTFVPLARMFDGNPYEELNPPLPEGGFATSEEHDPCA